MESNVLSSFVDQLPKMAMKLDYGNDLKSINEILWPDYSFGVGAVVGINREKTILSS